MIPATVCNSWASKKDYNVHLHTLKGGKTE